MNYFNRWKTPLHVKAASFFSLKAYYSKTIMWLMKTTGEMESSVLEVSPAAAGKTNALP